MVRFLSHPVLKGFTAAAAVIIATSQASPVLGVRLPRRAYAWQIWADAVLAVARGEAHGVTVALSVASFVMFMLLHRLRVFVRSVPSIKARPAVVQGINSFPTALIVIIIMIIIVGSARLDLVGVAVVGKIEPGLPPPRLPISGTTFASDVGHMWVSALISAVIGFVQAFSVAKAMALRFGTPIDPNQELLGLAAANGLGSFFNSHPQTGAFSRTVVNADAGAKTQLAGIVSGVLLILVVLFLTALFEFLPIAALGAMILFAVTGLIDVGTPRMLWAVDRRDFFVYAAAFLATVGLGIEQGILVGAAISLVRVVQESTMPHVAELGHMPEAKMPRAWRSLERFPGVAERVPGLRVLRFDSPLYFANALHFREVVLAMAGPCSEDALPPRAIVVDCSAVSILDSTALAVLEGIPSDLDKMADSHKQHRLDRLLDAAEQAGLASARLRELQHTPPPLRSAAKDYHPVLDYRETLRTPCDDSDLVLPGAAAAPTEEATAALLADRYLAVLGLPPHVPLFFLTCIPVPVVSVLQRSELFGTAERLREEAHVPSLWSCEHPCALTNPATECCVGFRPPPGGAAAVEHEVAADMRTGPEERLEASATAARSSDEAEERGGEPVPSVGGDEVLRSASTASGVVASTGAARGSGGGGGEAAGAGGAVTPVREPDSASPGASAGATAVRQAGVGLSMPAPKGRAHSLDSGTNAKSGITAMGHADQAVIRLRGGAAAAGRLARLSAIPLVHPPSRQAKVNSHFTRTTPFTDADTSVGVAADVNFHDHFPVLQLVLREQDIADAIDHITKMFAEFDARPVPVPSASAAKSAESSV